LSSNEQFHISRPAALVPAEGPTNKQTHTRMLAGSPASEHHAQIGDAELISD